MMADLIDYPSNRVKPGSLPKRGDKYQAYGLCEQGASPSFIFVFPDWSMRVFVYRELGFAQFQILNDKQDVHGHCAGWVTVNSAVYSYELIVTGDNIFGLWEKLCNHEVRWAWEMPKHGVDVSEGQPVVHSIEVRKYDSKTKAYY